MQTKFSATSLPYNFKTSVNIYFYEAVSRTLEACATKQIAWIISIFVSKNDLIIATIVWSNSKPLVSPNPGESTIIRGGLFSLPFIWYSVTLEVYDYDYDFPVYSTISIYLNVSVNFIPKW